MSGLRHVASTTPRATEPAGIAPGALTRFVDPGGECWMEIDGCEVQSCDDAGEPIDYDLTRTTITVEGWTKETIERVRGAS